MNSLIKTTIKRPVTVCVLVIILLAVGVLATLNMSTNLLPNINMPMLGITVVFPGAGAKSVEDTVTEPMENALQTIPGITELETRSYDNVSVSILTFDYGTDIDDKIDAIEDVLKTVTLPQGANDPIFVKVDMNGTAAATLSVYNDSDDLELLAKDADKMATKLRAIEGVGSVSVLGAPEKQISITALQGLDITALALVQALSKENLDLPLGTITQNGAVISVRNASDATSVLQVMQLPVNLPLGASGVSSLAALQTAVKTYATCTLAEFEDYVTKAVSARDAIEQIDGKPSSELEELQSNLSSIKSVMALVRNTSSMDLQDMWDNGIKLYVDRDSFKDMDEKQLRQWATSHNMSYETAKFIQDGAKDGSLEYKWQAMVDFRKAMEESHDETFTGEEITYKEFATLFQDGGSVDVEVAVKDDDGNVTSTTTQQYSYGGMDLLHSQTTHESADHIAANPDCDKKTFTQEQAANACEFADSVNTVAFNNIIDTVKEAEDKGEDPVISDAQFAALFINSTQGNEFAALMSPQVIHIIRLPNFNEDVEKSDGTIAKSIVGVLRQTKQKHVNDNGEAFYKNNKVVTKNDDKEIFVEINGVNYKINTFGRLVDDDGKLVDEEGKPITLSDQQIADNYYSYGQYLVFDDNELLALYQSLDLGDTDLGINLTLDTIRFIRICEYQDSAESIIAPVAYVGYVKPVSTHQAYAQYKRKPSVAIEVYTVSDANTTNVVKAVKKVIGNADIEGNVVLLDDKAEFITDSISNVLTSIVIGGVLAILIIYLFVGKIGSSLVVSITMPLSVLVALLGLWAMNISLNLVSLGGLAVGIGMLVDNSIVVLESITKRRDRGEGVFDSCLNGTREVAGSLLASTLTNICVFFPILFSGGLTREIFYDLVWAVLFSITMSLIVAVTVIPSLYHLIYSRSPRPRYKKDKDGNKVLVATFEDGEPRGESKALFDASGVKTVRKTPSAETVANDTDETSSKKVKRTKKRVDRSERKRGVLAKMENIYGNILSKVLTKRVLVCVVALVLFGSSVGLVFTTGVDFIPSVDKGVIEINMRFDGAATLEKVDESAQKTVSVITDEFGEGILYTAYTVGKQGMLPMNITGVIRLQVDTKKLNTDKTVNDIRNLLDKSNIYAKNISVSAIDGVVAELTGEMAGQSVTLLSDNMEALTSCAQVVASKLREIDGVVSVTDNTPIKGEQYSFVFDKDACAKKGVDYQNAVLMLRVGMSGYAAANIKVDGESQDVMVQFSNVTKDSIDELVNVVVGFGENGAVKLSDVLIMSENGNMYVVEEVESVVNKRDGKYVTTVDLETYGVDMGTINKRVSKVVSEILADNSEVTYMEGGVSYYLTDAMTGLVISLIAAFLLLYGVMACQFESLVKPFVVIMSIPFSFTGGFLALVITGTTLNVVSFVGIIMLMGVIVNGAIVMIDKIDQLIKDGVEPKQAVVEGCKSRLRPILMTTLTTILALTPLAIGIGRGSEFMQPMGIVVLGGLLLGTLVTLLLIPCFYCIVKRIKFDDNEKKRKRKQVDSPILDDVINSDVESEVSTESATTVPTAEIDNLI